MKKRLWCLIFLLLFCATVIVPRDTIVVKDNWQFIYASGVLGSDWNRLPDKFCE